MRSETLGLELDVVTRQRGKRSDELWCQLLCPCLVCHSNVVVLMVALRLGISRSLLCFERDLRVALQGGKGGCGEEHSQVQPAKACGYGCHNGDTQLLPSAQHKGEEGEEGVLRGAQRVPDVGAEMDLGRLTHLPPLRLGVGLSRVGSFGPTPRPATDPQVNGAG